MLSLRNKIQRQGRNLSPDKAGGKPRSLMAASNSMGCARRRQQGFSLITAIFLLVVVVSLGTMMLTFFAAQQQSSAQDVIGARAYQASYAGIEWGAFQITQSQVVVPVGQFATACQGGTSSVPVTPSVQPSLSGTTLSPTYALAVSCFAASHVEGTTPVWVYNLTATASGIEGATPGGVDYVERITQAVIWQ